MFKILLTSDNHLGHHRIEDLSFTHDDSFISFEETLQSAIKHKVDLIINTSDVFDYHSPSNYAISTACKILKDFHSQQPQFGYQNIISIHGNHDYHPESNTYAIDILNSSKLLTLFGKFTNERNKLVLEPQVFKDGANFTPPL